MSIDINYKNNSYSAPEQTVKAGDINITYMWWCPRCWDYHYGPWCPMDTLGDIIPMSTEPVLIPSICPHCGQVMWK